MQRLNYNGIYSRFESKSKDTRSILLSLKIDGANITYPYKHEAFMACDEVLGIANELESVNTILVKNNKLLGYNTDADGFYSFFEKINKANNKVLILGAGNTTKALQLILQQHKIPCVIANRSEKSLKRFANCETYLYDDLHNFLSKNNQNLTIINATSSSLQDVLPIDETICRQILAKSVLCIDLVYGKKTKLLALCDEMKIENIDGENMLINQASLSLEIFTEGIINHDIAREQMQKAYSL